jgi:hypothetical protein
MGVVRETADPSTGGHARDDLGGPRRSGLCSGATARLSTRATMVDKKAKVPKKPKGTKSKAGGVAKGK